MYHLELRKFPHTVCRFNQSEAQLRAIVVPWTNQEWIEEGERKWNSNEATLTVLEGPKLSMPELAMGRGWRNAQRRSEDVTQRVLAAFQQRPEPAQSSQPAGEPAGAAATDTATGVRGASAGASPQATSAGEAGQADLRLLADSLGLELLALLDAGPAPLSRVWALASERLGDAPAAQSLALAEQAVRSLLARALVVLQPSAGEGGGEVGEDRAEERLRAVESWTGGHGGSLEIARRP